MGKKDVPVNGQVRKYTHLPHPGEAVSVNPQRN